MPLALKKALTYRKIVINNQFYSVYTDLCSIVKIGLLVFITCFTQALIASTSWQKIVDASLETSTVFETASLPLAYQQTSLISLAKRVNYTFLINIPQTGRYAVFGWWPHADQLTQAATYRIVDDLQGVTLVTRSQQHLAGQWVELGEYYWRAGKHSIVLSNSEHSVLAIDAVRVVLLPDKKTRLAWRTDKLPLAKTNTPYQFQFIVDDSYGEVSYQLLSPLPQGLSLSFSGVLSGTPVQSGHWSITIRVLDSVGQQLEKTWSLYVFSNTNAFLLPSTLFSYQDKH
ncbi:golvesin C-terminal-like domain-containing protein [Zooshikella harenae]|uniref:Ig domain-containing protein n=1 Tax=Zooshikella harenae TaxID=2827238 RepID=A0ABS5ZBL4_9GAMM|nr:putative Ig domain-containing protein [Zooshikella harenae]MBU2710701.1 putative Ig domain-containing protein [Zooshikella harenae]